MAYKIFFTEDAQSDLAVVLDYISADNPSAAEQLGTSLVNHVEVLHFWHAASETRFSESAVSATDTHRCTLIRILFFIRVDLR